MMPLKKYILLELTLQYKLSSFCFTGVTKSITFTPAVMTKPLFGQNVLGLTLVLCIVFITDFFLWLHAKRFQSTEVSNSMAVPLWLSRFLSSQINLSAYQIRFTHSRISLLASQINF